MFRWQSTRVLLWLSDCRKPVFKPEEVLGICTGGTRIIAEGSVYVTRLSESVHEAEVTPTPWILL
jgi:hypothetical protein